MRRWRRCHTAQLAPPWLPAGCSSRVAARGIVVHTASVSVHEPLNETLFARGRCRAMASVRPAVMAAAAPFTHRWSGGHKFVRLWALDYRTAKSYLMFAVDEPAEGHCLPGWRDLPTLDAQTGLHRPLLVSAWWASSSPPNDAPRWTRPALRCPGPARAARPPTRAPLLRQDSSTIHPGIADLVGPGGNGAAFISGEG